MTRPIISEQTDLQVDACGLQCPLPLLKTRQALRHMRPGQMLVVQATDAGSARDIPAYVGQSSHQLVRREQADGCYTFLIRCGEQES
ncbi:MAG: sulfurtransferase TusA family protein [Alcanivorax sp.]|nr:sulfurtransferase TusA family protein [Alcanivorax sp.]